MRRISSVMSESLELAPPSWATINAEHAAAEGAARSALEHARLTGEMLARKKAEVGHGNWAGELAENFTGSARTAQRYMRLAQRWPELEANAPSMADLSLAAAEAMLTNPRPELPAASLDELAAKANEAHRKAEAAWAEAGIGGTLADFLNTVASLREVRDRRLYRETHATFEDYARDRWGISEELLALIGLASAPDDRADDDDAVVETHREPETVEEFTRASIARLYASRPEHENRDPYPEERMPDAFPPPAEVRAVGLDDIAVVGETELRSTRRVNYAAWLANILEYLPPIAVHRVGSRLVISDGRYRLEAARLRGWSSIPARIYEGSVRDARLYAASANAVGGEPMTRADWRHVWRNVANLEATE